MQLAEAAFFAAGRRQRGVAHSLYYDQQVRAGDWPLVVTVHDMIHERFGAGGKMLRWAKRAAVHRAALVITPSRSSASDLLMVYPNLRADVRIIPWGVAPAFLTERGGPARDVAGPFLLYVGARSGYKNAAVLLRALADAPHLSEYRLVLVGGEPLLAAERRRLISALGGRDRLVHLPSPSDDVLRTLYDSAGALVMTSRCEGFGLPVLEAMARGCPVACAGGGAPAEIAAGYAALFPPDDSRACADAVRRAVALPSASRESARTLARRYDWATTARAHAEAYRAVWQGSKS
jgi:glycosyltransferase involved in cell wall biosynthesis